MIPLLGLLLAVTAVALVLEPLIRAARGERITAGESLLVEGDDEDDPARERRDRALAALREIEFDKATGKLSDEDYAKLYERYSAEAVAVLRADERMSGSADKDEQSSAHPPIRSSADAVEQIIAQARRGGRGPKFCEECGAELEGRRRFCVECGQRVSAASPA